MALALPLRQVKWWHAEGWRMWYKTHGVDVDKEVEAPHGDGPDKAAIRRAYGPGPVVGR